MLDVENIEVMLNDSFSNLSKVNGKPKPGIYIVNGKKTVIR